MTNESDSTHALSGLGSAPSPAEIFAEADPKRKAVLAAMTRILEKRPLHVAVGDTTRKALAAEAGVSRQSLYERHADLWDRFDSLRQSTRPAAAGMAELEQALEDARSKLATLRRQKDEAAEAARQARQMADVFARTIAVLQEENRLANEEIARLSRQGAILAAPSTEGATIIVMPTARQTPDP